MPAHIRLGRVAGVRISLHYTWFVIGVLITLSLVSQFHAANPEWPSGVVWMAAVITGLLFFVAILVHELAHSLAAKAQGLPVRSITLFALGGVSQIEREPRTAAGEFWMALVGPLTSAVIGLICLASAVSLGWSVAGRSPGPAAAVLGWLGYINVGLAAFNMIPGFPLDGGRVLRAIVWRMTGDADRSTRVAARVGQAVALVLIFWGLLRFLSTGAFGPLWLALIGWFLLDAAAASQRQLEMESTLRDVHVRDVMVRDCAVVDARTALGDFVEEVARTGHRCFLATEDGRVVGLLTLDDIRRVPRGRWGETTVRATMRPLARLHSISPDASANEGLEVMSREHVSQLPVMSDGHLEGVLSRSRILELLETRRTLSAA